MDHRAIRSGGTTREKEGFSKRDLHASPLWIPCDCLWIDEESPSLGRSPYNLAPFLEILLCIQLRIRWIQRCIPISRTASSSSSHSTLPLVKTSFSRRQWHFSFFFLFFFSLSFPRIVKLYRWVYIREHGRKDSWPCLLPVGLSAGRRKEQGATGAETFRMVIVLGLAQDRSCTLKLRITRGPKGWPFSRLVYEQQSWSFRTLGAAGSRRMDD